MSARLDTELTKKYAAKPADKIAGDIPSWWVSFTKLKAVLSYLKYSAPVRFEMLFDLSAIDESERLKTGYTLFYHLLSVSHNQDIRILVNVENENIKIPTITDIWSSANWYEREIYDMFGLIFKGHPNLRRLLLPDYWKGHPLRKSYPFRATDMPPPFDLNTDDYARIMESYEIPDNRKPDEEDTMILNIGPHHPGTHGIIRLMVKLRGEELLEINQEIGYHHRGAEKLAERHTYHNYIPYTDRIDYLGGVAGELPYLLAIENMIGSHPPVRATVIRVMLTEFFRLSSHLVWIASFGHDVGAMAPAFYCFQVREKIFDFIEMVTGGRMHPAFFRIGGVAQDMPEGWQRIAIKACESVEELIPELEKLIIHSKIFQLRTKDVGVISKEQALDWGFTGPNLRASGLAWDLRKVRPYCGYENYEFDIPVADHNDSFNRIKIRIQELYETLKIIRQTIKRLSDMPVEPVLDMHCDQYAFPYKNRSLQDIETLIHHFIETGQGYNMPAGESFFATETSKGMTGYHLISDGGACPYRLRIRTPSVPHFQSVKPVCEGDQIGNLIVYISSIDYVLADLDR